METVTMRDPWLAQFATDAQPLIVAWFHSAAGQQPQTPEALLAIVTRRAHNTLAWSTTPQTRELCSVLLLALCHQRGQARAYAQAVLQQQAPPLPAEPGPQTDDADGAGTSC